MTEPPPDRILSPDGTRGWFAFMPDGSAIPERDEPWEAPPDGTVIRLMGEHTVPVPLWDQDGLMFGEPEELMRELGVSAALARDLAEWADRWHTDARQPRHDADAEALLVRLRQELGNRWVFVYQR